MYGSLTLHGVSQPRIWSFVSGAGMMVASVLTIDHFFAANFPTSIFEGSFCDINSFFNCDSSAYSNISAPGGVPMGYFGLVVGLLVALGALFPSAGFERTNKTIALFNGIGVIALLLYSVLILKSLCLLCSLYYVFSLLSLYLFWKYGLDRDQVHFPARFLRPSLKHTVTFAVVTALGAYAVVLYHQARHEAQSGGVAARVVKQYYNLPRVETPSLVSPSWTVQATDRFEDAPIRVIEYADFLCPDCRYLTEQLDRLKEEFEGKINVAFQYFPLDAQCNKVVDKDKHPGACDLSYMAAYNPEAFQAIHDEVFANMEAARDPAWRLELAQKYRIEAALSDSATQALVHQIINTGTEYEKTSDQYAHGIRSTPTMILNNRMIIGTLPYEQLRAIFQALVDEHDGQGFIENWVETGP